MDLDITLKEVFSEVQKEIKEELGVDISIQEIADVHESQFQAILLGINYNVGTRIPVFGSFFADYRVFDTEETKQLRAEKPFISKEEHKRRTTEIKIKRKKRTVEASNKRRKSLLLEDLLQENNRNVLMTKFNDVLTTLKNERR